MKIPLGTYRHHKGGMYKVVGVARHSETEENLVVYHKENQPSDLWVRPLDMFMETIEVAGVMQQRFTILEE